MSLISVLTRKGLRFPTILGDCNRAKPYSSFSCLACNGAELSNVKSEPNSHAQHKLIQRQCERALKGNEGKTRPCALSHKGMLVKLMWHETAALLLA